MTGKRAMTEGDDALSPVVGRVVRRRYPRLCTGAVEVEG